MTDKIRALLEQLGGSKDLVDKIMESLDQYKGTVRTDIQEEYRQRLEQAKTACIAEVDSYKKELSKKMQIFFESKVDKIEQQIAKQVAIKESAAETKLHAIAGLLEGVEVNGEKQNADLQAALKQVKELQESKTQLVAERQILTEKANRAHGIAAKALERTKILSKELVEAQAKGPAIVESKTPATKPAVKTLTEGRKVPKATTTRMTDESQLAKPVVKKEVPAPVNHMEGFSPDSIAANME